MSLLLFGCSDQEYPTIHVINETFETSNVLITLDRVKEDMNSRDKISYVEFTIKNNMDHPIQVPLSYHFVDHNNNLRDLIGYSSDEETVYLGETDPREEPFEIPANKEVKLSMDYEGFVKTFEWKLDFAMNNKVETFTFNISLDETI